MAKVYTHFSSCCSKVLAKFFNQQKVGCNGCSYQRGGKLTTPRWFQRFQICPDSSFLQLF